MILVTIVLDCKNSQMNGDNGDIRCLNLHMFINQKLLLVRTEDDKKYVKIHTRNKSVLFL